MINGLIQEYPKHICVANRNYEIDTDFRRWIGLHEALLDVDLTNNDKLMLIYELFVNEAPPVIYEKETLLKIGEFLKGNTYEAQSKKETKEDKRGKRVFSYTYDNEFIIGAFLECYRMDLVNIAYLHWYHFCALLHALNPNCELKQRIMYRSYDLSSIKDKHEKKRIKKIQKAIELPQLKNELSDEEIANIF